MTAPLQHGTDNGAGLMVVVDDQDTQDAIVGK
jgi:hypothetical protein